VFLVTSWHAVDRAWLGPLVHTSCGPCHSGPTGGILPWSSIADLSPFSEQHHCHFFVVITNAPSHSAALPFYLFYCAKRYLIRAWHCQTTPIWCIQIFTTVVKVKFLHGYCCHCRHQIFITTIAIKFLSPSCHHVAIEFS
jgi:hypothetical protein